MNKISYLKKPLLMAVLNMTPDSFSDGSLFNNVEEVTKHIRKMVLDGADIIDIGGESTRPGARFVETEEELERIIPIIKRIRSEMKGVLISVDTYKDKVADKAIIAGADIINDIWGMSNKSYDMLSIVAKHQVPVVVTHNQESTEYKKDIIHSILSFFEIIKNTAIKNDILEENLIFDPGIGFGKTREQNMEVLRRIKEIRQAIQSPILLGVSRKGFLGRITNNFDPKKRDIESLAAHLYLAEEGIDILRVHDVAENKRALSIWNALKNKQPFQKIN